MSARPRRVLLASLVEKSFGHGDPIPQFDAKFAYDLVLVRLFWS
jgi:hypothetical protein